MKRLLTILVAVMAIMTACSSEQMPVTKDIRITQTVDTVITYPSPLTAPRYSCNGKVLIFPKLIGSENKTTSFSVTADTVISGAALKEMGYVYSPTSDSATAGMFSGMPNWLWSLLKVLFWLAVLLLALWLLYELIRLIKTNLSPWNSSSVPAVTAVAVAPVVESNCSKITELTVLAHAMPSGGKASIAQDGTVSLEVYGQQPLISIENHGAGATFGPIHIGDRFSFEDYSGNQPPVPADSEKKI